MERKLEYIDKRLKTNEYILGEVYLITNCMNGKKYVGQAVSHRLNLGSYKPFGYQGRFRDHLSEAICNRKKKQCSFLNNAIRKYGADEFIVELLERCLPHEMNDREIYYIKTLGTIFPNGYNLTEGGKLGNTSEQQRKTAMQNTFLQFNEKKLDKFKDVDIDINNLEQYIREYTSYNETYFMIKVSRIKCIFVGQFLSKDDLYQRAITFLREVYKRNLATQSNCGNDFANSASTTSSREILNEGTRVMTGSNGNIEDENKSIRSQAPTVHDNDRKKIPLRLKVRYHGEGPET